MEARDPSQKLGFKISYRIIRKLRPETAWNPNYKGFKVSPKYDLRNGLEKRDFSKSRNLSRFKPFRLQEWLKHANVSWGSVNESF